MTVECLGGHLAREREFKIYFVECDLSCASVVLHSCESTSITPWVNINVDIQAR